MRPRLAWQLLSKIRMGMRDLRKWLMTGEREEGSMSPFRQSGKQTRLVTLTFMGVPAVQGGNKRHF